ncbi:MAG: hypothetical protein U0939_11290 [Pirellulales bacterium]
MSYEPHERLIEIDGRTRRALVFVPDELVASTEDRLPVVFAFHGGGSTAEGMIEFSGLAEKGRTAGFVTVFPSGTGRTPEALTWNGGNCCGRAMKDQVDDVDFIRCFIEHLDRWLPIDRRRLYATGMSNGGMMSYRLAAELSDQIAAIAPVGGPIGCLDCLPKRPVSVCHFHGTHDEFAPYEGGIGKRSLSKARFYSVQQSIDAWVRANGCAASPLIDELPVVVDDGTRVTRARFCDGREGSEVWLHTIHGCGHTWPGRSTSLKMLGPVTRNLNANDVMWEFFQCRRRE